MTDFTEAFDAEQDRRCRERQLVLLGALLASKELRPRVEEHYFADAMIGAASVDLTTAAHPTRLGLRQVLHDLGIGEWDENDGSPLDLLIEHVRLDSRLAVVWRDIATAIGQTNAVRAKTAAEKIAALEKTQRVVDEAADLLKATKDAIK